MIIYLFLLSSYAGTLCADGWVSPSKGRGACSHHGGVAKSPKDLSHSDKKADVAVVPFAVSSETKFSSDSEAGKVIPLTVKDMMPFLVNSDAVEVWLEEAQEKTRKGNLDKTDPNDRNVHFNIRSLVPAVWACADGEGKERVNFLCWEEDKANCTPEWHSLLELQCPVTCEKINPEN